MICDPEVMMKVDVILIRVLRTLTSFYIRRRCERTITWKLNAIESLFAASSWVFDTANFNLLYTKFNAFYNTQGMLQFVQISMVHTIAVKDEYF